MPDHVLDGLPEERHTDPLLALVRVLHVGLAAAWFGHKLLIPADLRRSLGAGVEPARALMARLGWAEQLGVITGLGTLLTGVVMVFMIGAAVVRSGIYVGLGIVLGAIAIGATVARPASVRLRAAVAAGNLEAAIPEARTISRVLAAESLLWAAALVSMLL